MSRPSIGQAFLIATCFGTHDLGMTYPATPEGLEAIRNTKQYEGTRWFLARGVGEKLADQLAIEVAARELHAEKSRLTSEAIPGTSIWIIEDSDAREK